LVAVEPVTADATVKVEGRGEQFRTKPLLVTPRHYGSPTATASQPPAHQSLTDYEAATMKPWGSQARSFPFFYIFSLFSSRQQREANEAPPQTDEM